jgi:hypothetical protein
MTDEILKLAKQCDLWDFFECSTDNKGDVLVIEKFYHAARADLEAELKQLRAELAAAQARIKEFESGGEAVAYLLRVDCEGDDWLHYPCNSIDQAITILKQDTDTDFSELLNDENSWHGDSCHFGFEIGSFTLYKLRCSLYAAPQPSDSAMREYAMKLREALEMLSFPNPSGEWSAYDTVEWVKAVAKEILNLPIPQGESTAEADCK